MLVNFRVKCHFEVLLTGNHAHSRCLAAFLLTSYRALCSPSCTGARFFSFPNIKLRI